MALKSLPPAFATDADRVERFEREARALAALNHPNIAAIYGLERDADTPSSFVNTPPNTSAADGCRGSRDNRAWDSPDCRAAEADSHREFGRLARTFKAALDDWT